MDAIRTTVGDRDLLIEIAPAAHEIAETEGGNFAGRDGTVINRIEDAAEAITSVCRTIHANAYQALADKKPDEFSVEFGVTLAGEAGVPLVTKGEASASFKVTAKWT